MELERVQKLISQAGVASRRKAEELIIAKKVKINGKVAMLGDKASFNDEITVNGIALTKEENVYILLNKPPRIITSASDPQGRQTVIDLIDIDKKIFPIGRLDYETTGTLLLTNDGALAHKLMHPSFEIKRVYRARLNEPLEKESLEFLNSNRVVLDNSASKQTVTQDDTKTYIVTLAVGTNHHVKRLFELVDREVITLTRIEFAGLTHVGELSQGQWRFLKPKEIKWLHTLTEKSEK